MAALKDSAEGNVSHCCMAGGCEVEPTRGDAHLEAEGSTLICPAVAATADVSIHLLWFVASWSAHPLLLLASSATKAGPENNEAEPESATAEAWQAATGTQAADGGGSSGSGIGTKGSSGDRARACAGICAACILPLSITP
jgi:hypothetical protein